MPCEGQAFEIQDGEEDGDKFPDTTSTGESKTLTQCPQAERRRHDGTKTIFDEAKVKGVRFPQLTCCVDNYP